MYQYLPEIGTPTWRRLLKLNPQQNSKISLVPFEDGEGELNIPLSIITEDTAVTTDKFIIRYNIENTAGDPIASSFTYSIETILGVKYLRIVFKAAVWDGTDWANLAEGVTTSYKVHTFISYLS
jgi:hypothetical protein